MTPNVKTVLGENYQGSIDWKHKDDLFVEFNAITSLVVSDHEAFMRHMRDELTPDERAAYRHDVHQCTAEMESLLRLVGTVNPIRVVEGHEESLFLLVVHEGVFGALILPADVLDQINKILDPSTESTAADTAGVVQMQFMRFDEKFVTEMELVDLNTEWLQSHQSVGVRDDITVNFAQYFENEEEETEMETQTTQPTANAPVTYAKVGVFAPAQGMEAHAAIQQYVESVFASPVAKDMIAVVAINKADISRLFGVVNVQEFYAVIEGRMSYVAIVEEGSGGGEECFARLVALESHVINEIHGNPAFVDLACRNIGLDLPLTVLKSNADFEQHTVKDCVVKIEREEFENLSPEYRFDFENNTWVPNNEPVNKVVGRARLHLKDIPLNTRANRNLVRSSLEANDKALTDKWKEDGTPISFFDWMTTNQGVNMKFLQDMAKIDALPDDQYIEAFCGFQKAQAQIAHKKDIDAGLTEKHLFDWVKEHYGVEFADLGKAQAELDIQGLTQEKALDESVDIDDAPGVFLVTFDGTIVEDHYPLIGADTPYALDAIRALLKNGHKVFILSHRIENEEEFNALEEYFTTNGVEVTGFVAALPASGNLLGSSIVWKNQEETADKVFVDYIVDHRQFGTSKVQVSNRDDAVPTLYWGDMVSQLKDYGYLTEEDTAEMMAALEAKMQAHQGG